MKKILLYHASYAVIEKPDIHFGRKNADFGQGFYLTKDLSFARRWAKERKGFSTYINTYELDLDDLLVTVLSRDEKWFDYISGNRKSMPDQLQESDIIMGPIANDIIYDLMGITTSGLLPKEISMKILLAGPEYQQLVIKTETGASHLRWLSAEEMKKEELDQSKELLKQEEEAFQKEIARILEEDES